MPRFAILPGLLILLYAQNPSAAAPSDPANATIRVATFNCSLNRTAAGKLSHDLKSGQDPQARQVARILRMIRPHIVLLNEFDFDSQQAALQSFTTEYLESTAEWAAEPPLAFPHSFTDSVNTGIASGRDLDHDGKTDGPGDALGFGRFPGQYGMVVLSQFPIEKESVRTFQELLWGSLPDNAIPAASTAGSEVWYDDSDVAVLRLSSKSHWDVPILVHGKRIHLLTSHPTPPAFDGPEDRNGRRNHDEIRFWAEYISPGPKDWLTDDDGIHGPLDEDASFIVLGDQNADPVDGDSYQTAIRLLLDHPRINANIAPSSHGAALAAEKQGGRNVQHKGDAHHDTADFSDSSVGNLRVDYVLPSRDLQITDSGVFWPVPGEAGADLVNCSDHRLVWIELNVESDARK